MGLFEKRGDDFLRKDCERLGIFSCYFWYVKFW